MNGLICLNCGSMDFEIWITTIVAYSGFDEEPCSQSETPIIEVYCSECGSAELAIVTLEESEIPLGEKPAKKVVEILEKKGIKEVPLLQKMIERGDCFIPVESCTKVSISELKSVLGMI